MFNNLLIDSATIQQFTTTNTGGIVTRSYTNLYTSAPTRMDMISQSNVMPEIAKREEFNDVTHIFYFNNNITGVTELMRIVYNGNNYNIKFVNPIKDSVGIHHFEVYTSFSIK